jgi:hypothetical protein
LDIARAARAGRREATKRPPSGPPDRRGGDPSRLPSGPPSRLPSGTPKRATERATEPPSEPPSTSRPPSRPPKRATERATERGTKSASTSTTKPATESGPPSGSPGRQTCRVCQQVGRASHRRGAELPTRPAHRPPSGYQFRPRAVTASHRPAGFDHWSGSASTTESTSDSDRLSNRLIEPTTESATQVDYRVGYCVGCQEGHQVGDRVDHVQPRTWPFQTNASVTLATESNLQNVLAGPRGLGRLQSFSEPQKRERREGKVRLSRPLRFRGSFTRNGSQLGRRRVGRSNGPVGSRSGADRVTDESGFNEPRKRENREGKVRLSRLIQEPPR